jgi:hypothetical protein
MVPPAVSNALRSPGQPLDLPTRAYMEPRFGQDFASVRVHADDEAARSARAIGARAYSVGHHVVFGRGRFAPATSAGRRLLAHELAHVVQQDQVTVPLLQRDVDPETGTAWATLSPPLQQQAEDLFGDCGQRIVDLLASQQKRSSALRTAWIGFYNRLRSQVAEADADAKLPGLQNRYDDFTNKMYELVTRFGGEWSALERQYRDERRWLVSLKSTDAAEAAKYLDETYKDAATRIPDLITDDDYLSLRHVLEKKEHIRVGQLRGTRARARELKQMMRTVADLRRKGEDAEKFVPGWSDRVLEEAAYLETFATVATEQRREYARELTELRKDLLDRRQETVNAKPADEGVLSKGYHLVKGGVEAVTGIFVEAAKEAVDLVQINIHFISFGYYEPRFVSDMAAAAEQGADTVDLLKGMVTGVIDTPSRFLEACRKDDWEAIGREAVNLYFLAKTLRDAPQTIKEIPGAVGKLPELLAKTRESVGILRARTLSLGLKTEGRFSPRTPTSAVPEARPAPPSRPTLLAEAPPASSAPVTKPTAEALPTGEQPAPGTTTRRLQDEQLAQQRRMQAQTQPAQQHQQPQAQHRPGGGGPAHPSTEATLRSLDERIAAAEAQLGPARQRTLEYQEHRRAAHESLKGGPIKEIWDVKEEIWVLKRQRAYPDRTLLKQAEVVGIKAADGTITPTAAVAGKGRRLDYAEVRGEQVIGGDLKSSHELVSSVAGGVKRPGPVEGTLRGKIAGQHDVEAQVSAEATRQNGKLVIRGVNVLTEKLDEIVVDPSNYSRALSTYEDLGGN